MEIHFQTSDHVVAVEIVAEQHIGTKLCSCNMLHILDTILVHCILHILGTILVHCLI